jgi:hypothetical protein
LLLVVPSSLFLSWIVAGVQPGCGSPASAYIPSRPRESQSSRRPFQQRVGPARDVRVAVLSPARLVTRDVRVAVLSPARLVSAGAERGGGGAGRRGGPVGARTCARRATCARQKMGGPGAGAAGCWHPGEALGAAAGRSSEVGATRESSNARTRLRCAPDSNSVQARAGRVWGALLLC